jgi:type III pantothenate kinase
MNLLVDIGNTRLKWATANNLDLIFGKPIVNAEINRNVLIQLWQTCGIPNQLAISCVSTSQLSDLVISVVNELWPGITLVQAESEAQGFGVTNAYQQPQKLGVDRWLGMIAGYHKYQKALCVVDCGTAITVDVIDVSGRHLGGLISSGLRLMKESLAKGTESLSLSDTGYPLGLATNTDAAIYSGTLSAACGLIERVLKNQPDTTQLLLTGGDAGIIATQLTRVANIEPDLVLHGLALTLHKPR